MIVVEIDEKKITMVGDILSYIKYFCRYKFNILWNKLIYEGDQGMYMALLILM